MDKKAILAELTSKHEENTFRQTQTWQKAFEAYNLANPNNKKRMGCGSCFRDVLKWLQN